MALSDVVNVFMFVHPATGVADKVAMFTPFGMNERMNLDWVVTNYDKFGIADLQNHRVYLLDWDTDFVPMDAEDDGDDEHIAIRLFDQKMLTDEQCLKYGKLHIDPANDATKGEALTQRLNREGL